jgi:hypothetical protein
MHDDEEKRLYQGDFYRHFKKVYPDVVAKIGNKWIPDRWSPRYDDFDANRCNGFKAFTKVIPEPYKSQIPSMVFEFLSKPFNVEEFMGKIQKTVNNYWNKIVICKTINENEEGNFRDMINTIRNLSILSKYGEIRTSMDIRTVRLENISAEKFEYSELPPVIPNLTGKVISTIVFPTNNGLWWELQEIKIVNTATMYFKANTPNKVPEMKCTIQDGVFMAIPSDLINTKLGGMFNKLLTDGTTSDRKKSKKKKMPTQNQIYNMGRIQLERLIDEYELDIPDEEDFDDDDLQDEIIKQLDII